MLYDLITRIDISVRQISSEIALLRTELAQKPSYEEMHKYVDGAFLDLNSRLQKIEEKCTQTSQQTDEIREIVREETFCHHEAHERYRLFKEGFFQESRKLRNIVISEIRKARKEHGAHVLNKLLYSNPKNFHKCIQDLMGKVSSKFLLLDSNSNPVSADIMNDYFTSICKTHPPLQNMPANSAVSDIPVIEIHQTQLKFENLVTNKSVYPGDIPTKLIVKCAYYLSVPLTAIFDQCFVDGIFPVCFKRAIISPIPKNKTPKVPSELRPISKTSIFSKIFESFIYNFL